MVKGSIQSLEDIRFVSTKNVLLCNIKFDEKNPNILSNEKNNALHHTVEKYGFAVDPWLNDLGDGTYLVIDGEHRIKLLLEKGVKSVQCKIFKVKYVDVQMLRQIANKLRGEHDKTKDADEFKSIFDNKKLDDFAKMLGEPIESFQDVLRKKFDMSFGNEEKEIPELPVKPKSKLGDIYQLGNHRVMCGDATKDLDKLIKNIEINLLLTDPPYGINIVHDDILTIHNKVGFVGIKNKPKSSLAHARKYKPMLSDDKPFEPKFLLKYGKTQIIFGANHFANKLPNQSHWLVWDKKLEGGLDHNNFSDVELMWTNVKKKSALIYRHLWSGLLRNGDRRTELKDRVHPTQKPVGLLSEIIKDYSKENHTILDPYLGSGSTLIACEQTNRICYGMELDPAYVDVIIQRFENFTGKKAKLLK